MNSPVTVNEEEDPIQATPGPILRQGSTPRPVRLSTEVDMLEKELESLQLHRRKLELVKQIETCRE